MAGDGWGWLGTAGVVAHCWGSLRIAALSQDFRKIHEKNDRIFAVFAGEANIFENCPVGSKVLVVNGSNLNIIMCN